VTVDRALLSHKGHENVHFEHLKIKYFFTYKRQLTLLILELKNF
jgi:hypothetical protein